MCNDDYERIKEAVHKGWTCDTCQSDEATIVILDNGLCVCWYCLTEIMTGNPVYKVMRGNDK